MGAYYLQSISARPEESDLVYEAIYCTLHIVCDINYKEFALRKLLKTLYKNIMSRDVIVNGGNKMERNMPPTI